MATDARYIWFNGTLTEWENANVHVMTHALHYGSSVFEGMRVYDTNVGPAIFRLQDHTERLLNSAKIYRMAVPYSADTLNAACKDVVLQNELEAAYIRPLVFRGAGSLGVAADNPIEVAIAAFPWGAYLGEEAREKGVDVCVSTWNRPAQNTFPTAAKAGGNYLSSQLIAMEARSHGYAEGIALDSNNFVSEGSAENIFVVKNGVIATPPTWCAILPGLTRDSVMKLAADLAYPVQEQPIPREALYLADEIFMTGTAAEITPVRSVDGIKIGTGRRGEITGRIQHEFFGLFTGTTPDRYGWLAPCKSPSVVRLTERTADPAPTVTSPPMRRPSENEAVAAHGNPTRT